jgi:hypothetical protein
MKSLSMRVMFLCQRSRGNDALFLILESDRAANEDVITVRFASRLHTSTLPGLYGFLVFIYFS